MYYDVKYWSTEERRNMGESDIWHTVEDFEQAIETARMLVRKGIAVCAEVVTDDDEVVIFGCDNKREW